MASSKDIPSINIRPASSVYGTYRRLSYRPWYAIAEFVDNSTQNYYDHKKDLLAVYRKESKSRRMRVEISYDGPKNTLIINDNANGMDIEELERAIVLDKPPKNRTGRCEFGMGLKTAACWFGTTWTITTTRLGSEKELMVKLHIPDLEANQTEEISVGTKKVRSTLHYTHIIIEGLYKPIKGRTAGRIQDQLGSMYREDLRSGEIEILWNGKPINFEEPPILVESSGKGPKYTWRKNISFSVPWDATGKILNAKGWVGIRMPGSQRDAGFALLRRGRVILGGPGEGYKPIEVFGQGNTFRSQRLVGEIHMDDWPVAQAKDAFDWSGGLEDEFIEHLKLACKDYMDKCETVRERIRPISKTDMQLVVEPTQRILSDHRFGHAVEQEISLPWPPKSADEALKDAKKLAKVSEGPIVFRIRVGPETWEFHLHWQDQLSDAHWMSVSYPKDNLINIFLNMAHPFFAHYVNTPGFLDFTHKFVIALALAERMARKVHGDQLISPDDFRNYMNRVLRTVEDLEEHHAG
jgi:Histidine kinase-, DNA gyrase B-, and HSP90-like ATPase